MPVSASTLKLLMDAGLSGEALIEVVASIDADEAAATPVKSPSAIRTARYRAHSGWEINPEVRAYVLDRDEGTCQDCGEIDDICIDHIIPVSKGGSATAENLQVLCRPCNSRKRDRVRKRDSARIKRNKAELSGTPFDKENTPIPPKEIKSPKENPPKGGQKKGPAGILETVLSPETAKAVVEHRTKLKRPMTDKAAELLAKRLSTASEAGFTPEQAANLMIERGWQSIELEWLAKSAPPTDGPKPEDETRWKTRLAHARRVGAWSSPEWGPPPGKSGCRAPPSLLEAGDKREWPEFERTG